MSFSTCLFTFQFIVLITGEEIPLAVSVINKMNHEFLCNTWYGYGHSDPIFYCPPDTRGISVKVKRLTKEDKKRQLRICEVEVQGFPGDYN